VHPITIFAGITSKLILLQFVTKSPAVARIADCTGCQWPTRSSKIDDFYFNVPMCDFISM